MCSLLCLYMAYIALYLLLEVGFSTLFFVLIFAARINVNSGKWICFAFTAMLWLENWLTACYLRLLFCCLVPVHSLWNMEHGFFQASDTTFLCESETVHTWGRNMRLHLCCMYGAPLLHQSLQLSVRPPPLLPRACVAC